MYIVASGKTDIGLVRENNEDSFLIDNDNGIFVVCDGVGGEKAGEIASSKSVELISHYLDVEDEFLAECRGGEVEDRDIFYFISETIRSVCHDIHHMSNEHPEFQNMATTMTMAISMGPKVLIAHVGDSRAYIINNSGVHQLSEDHTLVQEFLKKGLIKDEESATNLKNILTRSIGKELSVEVDCLMVPVNDGDRIILCSDGVSNYFGGSADLLYTIHGETAEDQADSLIRFALRNNGSDNATALVLEVFEDDNTDSFEVIQESSVLELLGECEIFSELNYRQLSRIRSYMNIVYLDKSEELLTSSEKYSGYYIILDGGILDSDELLTRGESFGLKALYRDHFSATTKTAARKTQLICLDRKRFRSFSQKFPHIACKIHLNIVNYLIER